LNGIASQRSGAAIQACARIRAVVEVLDAAAVRRRE